MVASKMIDMGHLMRNTGSLSLVVFGCAILGMMMGTKVVDAYNFQPSPWISAHATFYGDETARETMGGACGYGNLFTNGYGVETAALSSVLFRGGQACGTCYQLKCVNSRWCHPRAPPITITATNLCPPNWYKPTNAGGWCNPPRSHFDLSFPIFTRIAEMRGGIVPVSYRRVPCKRYGGIRFEFSGNNHWLLVTVTNVGGGGDVSRMWVKGSKTNRWISMSRNWGAKFQAFASLRGQALSFRVQSGSTGQIVTANYVTNPYWSFGLTYPSNVNFY